MAAAVRLTALALRRPRWSFGAGCSAAGVAAWWSTTIPVSSHCESVWTGSQELQVQKLGTAGSAELLQRALWLLIAFLPVLLLAPVACASPWFRERYFWAAVRASIVRSRSGALTKWGQWAAVRPDFFPSALCFELATLQASAPAHSETETRLALAGIPGIAKLEPAPLASGSVAQVHLAEYYGERVAVKVRHPGVAERMHLDFELMLRIASALDRLPGCGWLNVSGAVSQFKDSMSQQTDLTVEAANLKQLRANFVRKRRWVRFPEVLYSSPGVLVESYEPGELMTTFARQWEGKQAASATPEQAAFVITRGQDLYLQMLLVDNFMHADLHPGNVIFREPPKQLVLVDAGMSTSLSNTERRNFIGLLQAMGDGDGRAASEHLLHFSEEQRCPSPEQFRTEVTELFSSHCHGYGRNVDIDRVVRDMMKAVYRNRVTVDGAYASVLANMLCLESLVKDLNPRFNILDAAYPLFRAHQLLGDTAFRSLFSGLVAWAPPPVWDLVYRVNHYAGLHGDRLIRYQI